MVATIFVRRIGARHTSSRRINIWEKSIAVLADALAKPGALGGGGEAQPREQLALAAQRLEAGDRPALNEALEEELRSQYSIGYTPDAQTASNDYRRIHLTTRQKSMTVQTREGYYPS